MLLGDPRVSDLQDGTRCHMVGMVADGCLSSLWTGEHIILHNFQGVDGKWSFFGLQVAPPVQGVSALSVREDTCCIYIPDADLDSYRTLVELCSGLGGLAIGAQQLGARTLLSVDKSPLACEAIQLNGGQSLLGDFTQDSVQQEIAVFCSGVRSVVTAGFPCQPYSVMGSQAGLADPRGQVLLSVLQVAWRIQSVALILECVAEVASFASTLEVIRHFARAAHFQVHEVILDLQDQWASRRRRWWAALIPLDFHSQPIPVWPDARDQWPVARVIPEWPLWQPAEEESLCWTADEVAKYGDEAYGRDSRCLCLTGKAPTAVHSWGNALTRCGCRQTGFTDQRLRSGGLRGLGVLDSTGQGRRHLHPAEAGLLNGIPVSFRYPPAPRSGLCLVGQVSSPLQSLWVYSHLLRTAEVALLGATSVDPHQALSSFQHSLLCQRQDCWFVPSVVQPGSVPLQIGGQVVEVHLQGPTTVEALLQQEGLKVSGYVTEVFADRQLPATAWIHAVAPVASLQVRLRPKRQAKGLPTCSDIRVCFLTTDGLVHCQCSAGTRLVAVCLAHGIACDTLLDVCSRQAIAPLHRVQASLVLDARPPSPASSPSGAVTDAVLWTAVRILLQDSASDAQLLHPACASWLLQLPTAHAPSVPAFCEHGHFLVLFSHEEHWACLHAKPWGTEELLITYFDGIPARCLSAAKHLAAQLCALSGRKCRAFRERNCVLQEGSFDCGAVAAFHAGLALSGSLIGLDRWVCSAFQRAIPGPAREVAFGGLSDEQVKQLKSILQDRGVPEVQLDMRVQQALQKLGAGSLATALKATNSWASLKAIASKPGSQFQWVHADELAAHIEVKAQARFGTAVSNPKAKKTKTVTRPPSTPLVVDPTKLQLAPGSFVASDGAALSQLAFDEVSTEARGIAFCSMQQVLPFLQNFRTLSMEPLGLVTTTALSSECCGNAPVVPVRFPVVYEPTAEAILLQGSLVQLGDESVQLASANIQELDQLDTVTCRLSLYRDETSLPWTEVTKAPLRELLHHTPGLLLCKDPACTQSCGKFHAAVDEAVDRLVLDVWGRQWAKLAGGRDTPSKAEAFHCLIRVPSSALPHLDRLGVAGLYFEPRTSDGAKPHLSYAVVWMPSMDAQAALHVVRTNPKALALARLGSKFGVRVREADEQAMFALLRPGHDFIKVRATLRFRLYPLPHGVQRKSVVQALAAWKWKAKPLQPCRGGSDGAAWEVGAEEEPPAPALALGDSFVLVTPVKLPSSAGPAPSAVCASRRTRKSIIYDDEPEAEDPWLHGKDPWSTFRAPPGLSQPKPAATATSPAASKLSQVRSELSAEVRQLVQESVAHGSGSTPQTDKRIQQLEVGMQELRQQNGKFENWFATFGQQVSDTKAQIGEVRQAVASQQKDLAQVKGEVAKQSDVILH